MDVSAMGPMDKGRKVLVVGYDHDKPALARVMATLGGLGHSADIGDYIPKTKAFSRHDRNQGEKERARRLKRGK